MAVVTELEQELAKWEMRDSQFTDRSRGLPPGRQGMATHYPFMMVRAQRSPLTGGKWLVTLPPPPFYGFRDENEYNRAVEAAAAFTTANQRIVNNDHERAKAQHRIRMTSDRVMMNVLSVLKSRTSTAGFSGVIIVASRSTCVEMST